MISAQRTFFPIIKLVFGGQHEFYLFHYNAILKDRITLKSTQSSIEIGSIVVKKHMSF